MVLVLAVRERAAVRAAVSGARYAADGEAPLLAVRVFVFSAAVDQNNTNCLRLEFPAGFVASSVSVASPSGITTAILSGGSAITLSSGVDLDGSTVNFTVNFSTFPSAGSYTATNKSGNGCPGNRFTHDTIMRYLLLAIENLYTELVLYVCPGSSTVEGNEG